MELSLSIASFPVDTETQEDMHRLAELFTAYYRTVLHAPAWGQESARGFAVLAYTEDNELLGFASALDIVGLHHYEWSAIVHPDFRRQSIGTALAEGIAYALNQRAAEGELAAFISNQEAEFFMQSLGYNADFKEIQLGAEVLESYELPAGLKIEPYSGEQAELEALFHAAFDEEAIPVMFSNIDEAGRDIWLLLKGAELLGTATFIAEETDLWVTAFAVHPEQQGKGYGQAFLHWCRNYAFSIGKDQVLLDVDTENSEVDFYGEAGFYSVHAVEYWKKPAE